MDPPLIMSHRLHRIAAQRLIAKPYQPVGEGLQGDRPRPERCCSSPSSKLAANRLLPALVGVLAQFFQGGGPISRRGRLTTRRKAVSPSGFTSSLEVGHDVLDPVREKTRYRRRYGRECGWSSAPSPMRDRWLPR